MSNFSCDEIYQLCMVERMVYILLQALQPLESLREKCPMGEGTSLIQHKGLQPLFCQHPRMSGRRTVENPHLYSGSIACEGRAVAMLEEWNHILDKVLVKPQFHCI